jgi:hypothetical protein
MRMASHHDIEHHHDLLAAWLSRVDDPAARAGTLVHEAAADLTRITVAAPDDLDAALNRFGRRAGTDGWDLDRVTSWVHTLALVLDEHRATREATAVRSFDAGVALGRGWATGYAHRTQVDGCTDPDTGLPTAAMLRWRLRQTYDHCLTLGIETPLAYAVVVVDLEGTRRDALAQGLVRAHAAAHIRDAFPSGDTVVAAGHRIIVLASNDATLADRVITLTAQLRCEPALATLQAIAWVESLPRYRDQIDAFLSDLLA